MKTFQRSLLSTAILLLGACSPLVYGKLDDPSVAVTQTGIGPVPAYTGPALTVPANLFSFQFDLGKVTVDDKTLTDSKTKDSSMKLNGAAVAIAAGSAATFQGIDTFVLTLTIPGGTPVEIAKYEKNKTGSLSADGKTITLAASGNVELLKYLSNTALTVSMGGSGTPPNVAWTGAVTFDFHLIAQYNVL